MRELLIRAWLQPLVVGLSLVLSIYGASWVTMHWSSSSIDHCTETLAELNVRIAPARKTLVKMKETTYGVDMQEISGERYVALLPGTPRRAALTLDEWPLYEAVERVRELYNRLGPAIDGSLGDVIRAIREGAAAALRAGHIHAETGRILTASSRSSEPECNVLDRILREDLRSVRRPLEVTWQCGRNRDHGPRQ